jgi:2-polyprenyl-3-methyl-5-hydroxy-6-metoxy-1,4-benzoquinol methylase
MRSCPICNGPVSHQVRLCPASFNYGSNHELVECLKCGGTYFDPSPTLDQLRVFYSVEGYEFSRYSQEHRAQVIAKKYLKDNQSGNFLDIGCGTGYLLNEIKAKTDWKVYGVELSTKASDFARHTLKLESVSNTDLSGAEYPDNFFDILHVSEVLEHVPSPVEFMRECRRIIKPEGTMLLSLPNGRSDRQGLLDYWRSFAKPPCHASGHIYFFSQKSLYLLARDTGFEITGSKTYAFKQGLRSLGLFPKRKNGHEMYAPRLKPEVQTTAEISVAEPKHSELFYRTKYKIRDFVTVSGMLRVGHGFRLVLKPN